MQEGMTNNASNPPVSLRGERFDVRFVCGWQVSQLAAEFSRKPRNDLRSTLLSI